MNHRAENKLSYLEQLRSGRLRSPAGFEFSPLVLVSTPWFTDPERLFRKVKGAPPSSLGEGAHLPTKRHAGIQPGSSGWQARRGEDPGYAPSKRPGGRLGTQSGSELIPTDGPRETEGPGLARPTLPGSPAPPRLGGPREANGSPSRLLPRARPPSTPTVPLEHPQILRFGVPRPLPPTAARTRSPPARQLLQSCRAGCPGGGTRRRGPPPCASDPAPSAPPGPARPPRWRAGDQVPRPHAHVLPPRASRISRRSPLPRSWPGRPRGAGRGLGRGDAPPAAAAAGSQSRSGSGRGELLPGGGGRRCSRCRRRRGAGLGATRPPISGRRCAGSSAPAGGRLLARQTLPHAEPAEKRRRLFLLPLPPPSPSSFPPLPQLPAGSLLVARRALAAT